MTKKIELTHLAVLSEGTLRLVRTDGEDGIVELAAMAVGDEIGRRSLADVVSAAMTLAEISQTLGGGKKKVVTTTGPKGAVHPTPNDLPPLTEIMDEPTAATGKSRSGQDKPTPKRLRNVRARKSSKKAGDVMDRLHSHPTNGKRPKRGSEKRYNDADIFDLIDQAHGLRPSEVAHAICEQHGVEYFHKDPLVKSVMNRMRNLKLSGGLVVDDDGVYRLPSVMVDQQELHEVLRRDDPPVEKAGDSVDDRAEGNFPVPLGSGRMSRAEAMDRHGPPAYLRDQRASEAG